MGVCSAHMHTTLEPKEELTYSFDVWKQAMLATLFISAAPVFILILIPVHNAAQNKKLLNILLAFAMGGLLGDVFLHLLPHSFSSHEHGHDHDHHSHEEHHHHEDHHHNHEHHHDHEHHHHEDHHNHEHHHGEHTHDHDHSHDHEHHHGEHHNHVDDRHHDHDHSHDHEHHHHDHEHDHDHHHSHEGHHNHGEHQKDAHHHSHDDHQHGEHSHSLGDLMTGIWIIVGIFVFLIVEKTLRQIAGGHGHSHAVQKPKEHNEKKQNEKSPKEGLRNRKNKEKKVVSKLQQQLVEEHHHVSAVSGFLNLAADFTHNFTDGLAIGATFVAGERMGMVTTLAILLHEVPHEIGDFAILVHSGFTKWQAMKLQFVTAIGALLGTAVGITTGGLTSASTVILPITAGGFIYISTVSVIPELLDDCTSTVQTILEIIAACIGVSFMAVIALLE